ncbi:MAG: hypothetical protein ACYC7F_06655 [Gemmatimonadaceae bacterium]
MRMLTPLLAATAVLGACSLHVGRTPTPAPSAVQGTLAQIYYWRAKPGKFDEYTRYVRDIAEPIDAEGQRNGAFLSVTTFMTRDTTSAWTHMRVFVLRDSTQLREMSGKLDAAGVRLEPDSVKRRLRGEYSATLRDRVGAATVEILR